MRTYYWDRSGFERHYKKHPEGDDRDCWCDLCNDYPGPISRDAYRQRSLDIIREPWLVFRAEYRAHNDAPSVPTRYFVDRMQCVTATDAKASEEGKARIKTCYHNHPYGHHRVANALAEKIKFVKHWSAKKESGRVFQPKIEDHNLDPYERRMLATYFKELQSTSRSRSR